MVFSLLSLSLVPYAVVCCAFVALSAVATTRCFIFCVSLRAKQNIHSRAEQIGASERKRGVGRGSAPQPNELETKKSDFGSQETEHTMDGSRLNETGYEMPDNLI